MARHVLGIAQEQHAVRLQGEVEQRDHLALQLGIKVDQQVAAGDEVDARERRILDDAVLREDAQLPELLDHAISVAFLHEPARQSLRRHVARDGGGVTGGTGCGERAAVEVGREDLDLRSIVEGRHVLTQQDAERVGFLTGRAADHPYADAVLPGLAGEQRWDDQALEEFELPCVAEELGDADQEVVEELLRLFGALAQEIQIGSDVGCPDDLHTALDPAEEGSGLVAVEIVTGPLAQDRGDARQRDRYIGGIRAALWDAGGEDLTDAFLDPLGELINRQHGIRQRSGVVAAGEFARARFLRLLRERQPTRLLDRLEAKRSVGASAGEDHCNALTVLVGSERDDEAVDRPALAGSLLGALDLDPAALQAHDHVGIRQVGPPRHQWRVVLDRAQVMAGLSQRLSERIRVKRLPVLQHDDERHVGLWRQLPQEVQERARARRRSADCNDGGLLALGDGMLGGFHHDRVPLDLTDDSTTQDAPTQDARHMSRVRTAPPHSREKQTGACLNRPVRPHSPKAPGATARAERPSGSSRHSRCIRPRVPRTSRQGPAAQRCGHQRPCAGQAQRAPR